MKIFELNKLNGHKDVVNSVCFSPDGTMLASGSSDNSICLLDVKPEKKQQNQKDMMNVPIQSVSFLMDKSIRLWDLKAGQQLQSIINGHSDDVLGVCFSSDGTKLESSSRDTSICLWDVKTGKLKMKFEGHTNSISSVSFSPNCNLMASCNKDNFIFLLDVNTGKQVCKLVGHNGTVLSLCFSPDGSILASSSRDNSIRLWNVQVGQQQSQLNGHGGQVQSLCFSHDGTKLASGSVDSCICLWDQKKDVEICKINCQIGIIFSVCFSPDGNSLASGSEDKSIRLWDGKTGKEIQSSDKSYKDILAQFNTPLFQNTPFVSTNITILLISKKAIIQAQGALILKREFVNQSGIDLKTLFQQKGCFILDKQVELQQSDI